MKNTLIKIAVWILVIKEIWLLLGVPTVDNAVISFLTVGAIPGTNKTLTPDEVYRLVIVLFLVAGGLIFRKDLLRLFRRLQTSHAERTAYSIMPIPHPLSLVAIETVVSQKPGGAVSPAGQQRQRMHIWSWRLLGMWLLFRLQALRLVAVIKRSVQHYAKSLASYTRHTASALRKLSIIIGTFVAHEAIAFWRSIEPYLRQFDSYLERKLHQYDQTATLLSIGSEMSSTIRKWREEYRTLRESDTQPRK